VLNCRIDRAELERSLQEAECHVERGEQNIAQPQRWKSLGNLGVVKADAAGIAYAIKKGWLIGVGEPPHSVCLTEAGRSLVDRR
jgi:hypothetical protein